MTQEILIPNKQQEKLSCVLHGADHLKKTMVVICHGLADNKKNPFLVAIANALAHEKIPALRIDFAGNGQSEGLFIEATYHKEADDLRAILDYYLEIGVERFVLIGHSMGGGVIKIVAGDERYAKFIVGLVSLAGVSRAESFREKFETLARLIEEEGKAYLWEDKYGKQFPIDGKYVKSAETIEIHKTANNIYCPILCVQGDEDLLMRKQQTQEYLKSFAGPSTFIILKGVNHVFNNNKDREIKEKTHKELIDLVVPWVENIYRS